MKGEFAEPDAGATHGPHPEAPLSGLEGCSSSHDRSCITGFPVVAPQHEGRVPRNGGRVRRAPAPGMAVRASWSVLRGRYAAPQDGMWWMALGDSVAKRRNRLVGAMRRARSPWAGFARWTSRRQRRRCFSRRHAIVPDLRPARSPRTPARRTAPHDD